VRGGTPGGRPRLRVLVLSLGAGWTWVSVKAANSRPSCPRAASANMQAQVFLRPPAPLRLKDKNGPRPGTAPSAPEPAGEATARRRAAACLTPARSVRSTDSHPTTRGIEEKKRGRGSHHTNREQGVPSLASVRPVWGVALSTPDAPVARQRGTRKSPVAHERRVYRNRVTATRTEDRPGPPGDESSFVALIARVWRGAKLEAQAIGRKSILRGALASTPGCPDRGLHAVRHGSR
jgi:hypothetical protein